MNKNKEKETSANNLESKDTKEKTLKQEETPSPTETPRITAFQKLLASRRGTHSNLKSEIFRRKGGDDSVHMSLSEQIAQRKNQV